MPVSFKVVEYTQVNLYVTPTSNAVKERKKGEAERIYKLSSMGTGLRGCVNREVGLGSHSLYLYKLSSVGTGLRGCVNREVGLGSHSLYLYKLSSVGTGLRGCVNREVGLGSHSLYLYKLSSVGTGLRGCVNRDVGLGSHSLYLSFPNPHKPSGFCGRKAPWKKKKSMGFAFLSSCVVM